MAVQKYELKAASLAAQWLGDAESFADMQELAQAEIEMPISGPLLVPYEESTLSLNVNDWLVRSYGELYALEDGPDPSNIPDTAFQYFYMPFTH